MRLPNYKRLDKNNFPQEFRDLIDKLGFTVNNDMEVLFQALNRRASLKDNFLCVVKEVEVIVDSNGIPKNTASFQIDIPNMRVLGCMVINDVNQTNSTGYVTSAPYINFSQTTSAVSIKHVTGLIPDNSYILTIIAWGE